MILVTGGTGLIGAHIVSELLTRGYEVRVFSRNKNKFNQLLKTLSIYHENAKELLKHKCSFVQGDTTDYDEVKSAMFGCSHVVHAAALVSFAKKDFGRMMVINRYGTANVMNAAMELSISRVLHISSTAAIGTDNPFGDSIKRETNTWNGNELSTGYAMSKFSSEKEVWRAFEEGLKGVIVNPSVVFGPGNWDDSSLKILRSVKNGLKYYTKGANAFVDVRDVAQLSIDLLLSNITNERFLVLGENTSFKELFDLISAQLNVKSPTKIAKPWQTDLAWRLDWLRSLFSGKKPTITKESAHSAHETTVYSNEKIKKAFPTFKFKTLEEMISFAIKNQLR